MDSLKCCRLIETLKTFSAGEFSDFEKIAVSPFFSKGRNYTPYIKALKKYFPDFSSKDFRKNNARKIIFKIANPGKIYNDQFMKNIFTDLIHFAEEVLFQNVSKNHNLHNLSFLVIEEAKRNLFPLANHNINLLGKRLDENGIDEMYFYNKGMNEIAYTVFYNKTHGKNHVTGKPFTTGTNFIFFSVITLALSIYNTSLRKEMQNTDNEPQFNESFMSFVDFEKFEKYLLSVNVPNKELILIFVYYLIHKKYKSGYGNYEKMRSLVFRNYPKFNSRMLFYVTSILLATLHDNKDKIKDEIYREEYHNIVLFSLSNNCYKIMNSAAFPFNRFRSYCHNALELGKIDWVKIFAEKYIPELLPELQEETVHLINANLLFRDKLYEESLDEIRIKYKNVFSKIDQRILKLKIFYHKGIYIHAEESLESFKKFINKNEVTKHFFRDDLITFSKYYRKLLESEEGKENDTGIILNDLRKSHAFTERHWLIGCFENLIKNN